MPKTYCYDELGLDHCECGTRNQSWEEWHYCDYKRMLGRPIPMPSAEEIMKMEWRMDMARRISHYCENAPGLREDLIVMLYKI